ncbi:hypothetical protein AVEN_84750-1 [Araneus ventricosus]|uniref:Uncharacterized protein n=1 Tax=Araneus ventricosus TaxID=182803 RepID=A0A4Y2UZW6_ARAVE|nr:hypothetical protein AVEN_84750-1 [Araneus ventricosus]
MSESAMSQQQTFRAYSSPQALGKAVKKVKKSLPTSPREKQAVVEKLASHVELLIPSTKPRKKNGLKEKEILLERVAIEKGFKSINELKGKQSCHCIKKAGSSSANMFLNTGDDIPFKTKVGILESKVSGFSKSSATFIELEKYFSGYYKDNWYIG